MTTLSAQPTTGRQQGHQHRIPLVTTDQVRDTLDDADNDFEILKEVASEVWLLRRKHDGREFVGWPWDIETTAPRLDALLKRGADRPIMGLLSHPNLVSFITTRNFDIMIGRAVQRRQLSIWDYCGAGSLETLIRKSAYPIKFCTQTGNVKGWLPESICWHVVLSLLSALSWLHEGYYEEDTPVWDDASTDGQPRREVRSVTAEDRNDEDWMPILHRAIVPGNIYFLEPDGIETYGLCKLGNYSRVFVSGHVGTDNLGVSDAAVCGELDTLNLGQVRRDIGKDIYTLEKGTRPYFKGNEILAVGTILYQMMTRERLPDKEDCESCQVKHWQETGTKPCPIMPNGGQFVLKDKTDLLTPYYTIFLITVLERLLEHGRRGAYAPGMLQLAKSCYQSWRTDRAAGREYRDTYDDLVQRKHNKDREDGLEAARAHAQAGSMGVAVDIVDVAVRAQTAVDQRDEARRRQLEAQARADIDAQDAANAPTEAEEQAAQDQEERDDQDRLARLRQLARGADSGTAARSI